MPKVTDNISASQLTWTESTGIHGYVHHPTKKVQALLGRVLLLLLDVYSHYCRGPWAGKNNFRTAVTWKSETPGGKAAETWAGQEGRKTRSIYAGGFLANIHAAIAAARPCSK